MNASQEKLLSNIEAHHLNSEQKKAVLQTEGKILILAGAGSGKTSTITYRIAHLLKNLHVNPEDILALTFTNKAAKEMQTRICKITSKSVAKKMLLCTFHSFCLKILRQEIHRLGFTSNFSIYDEKDIKRLLSQSAKDLLEIDKNLPSFQTSLDEIQKARWNGDGPCENSAHELRPQFSQFTQELYKCLDISLRAYNALDFDSLLSYTVKLFEENPDVLKKYQLQYKYIMIDEYQDTNPIQYKLAKFLSGYHQNLCVVGDDDQSIYGWRGAKIQNILEFESDYLIKLQQNYRSTTTILNAANSIIKNNEKRHDKNLWSKKNSNIPIQVFHAPSDIEEAEAVISRIIDLKEKHQFKWRDFAILYRSNSLSRPFEAALMQTSWKSAKGWKRGIPYQVFGGLELYEKSEIKDMLAYLKVIANPLDSHSLIRIINYPRRGISEKTLDLLTQEQRTKNIPLWQLLCDIAHDTNSAQALMEHISKKAYNGICRFVSVITQATKDFSQKDLSASLTNLVDEIEYKKAIQDEVKSQKMQEFKWENINQMIHMLKTYENDTDNPQVSLQDFLDNTLLDEKSFKKDQLNEEDKLSLMTFHSSKGLEFPVCFLVGLEDHIIPHEKSLMETGLEEERRLMYVALTRCRERLYLSMSRKRVKHGKPIASTPSRFLFELPKELLKMTNWKFIEENF